MNILCNSRTVAQPFQKRLQRLKQSLFINYLSLNSVCLVFYDNTKQELSYRKQIARQLRTQYYEGIYDSPVTSKSRLRVTQGHWKWNHWTDHTRLTISRVIWRWILSWPWNVGQRSLKVIENGAVRWKSRNFYTPPVFSAHVEILWRCLMLVKLEWLGYRMVKKNYDNMLSRFHLIPERHGQTDRQTDGQTDWQTELLYQYRASVCWRAIKTRHWWNSQCSIYSFIL